MSPGGAAAAGRCLRALGMAALAVVSGAAPAGADDTQVWLTVNATKTLKQSWWASVEGHGRWVSDAGDYQRTTLRLQGGRGLGRAVTLGFGYEHTWPDQRLYRTEDRLWQQAILAHAAGAWTFSHRFRTEQRFIDGADRMLPRFRYSVRVSHPLGGSRWGVYAGTELMWRLRNVQFAGVPVEAGFDRDRTAAGISRRVGSALSVEAGYAFQHARLGSALPDVREHAIQMAALWRF